jgi:hypothetical protein
MEMAERISSATVEFYLVREQEKKKKKSSKNKA